MHTEHVKIYFFISFMSIVGLMPGILVLSSVAALIWGLFLMLVQPDIKLGNKKFWIVTFILAILSGFLIGKTDFYLWIIPVSTKGVVAGVNMLFRGFVIFSTVIFWSSRVKHAQITKFFDRIGAHRLGVSLGFALSSIPDLSIRFKTEFGGHQRLRIRSVLLFWEQVLKDSVIMAENYAKSDIGNTNTAITQLPRTNIKSNNGKTRNNAK